MTVIAFVLLSEIFAQNIINPSSRSDLGLGFQSNCFDSTFEKRYDVLVNRPILNFGVTVLLDYRYTQKVTPEQIQIAIDSVNAMFQPARFRLMNLRIVTLEQQYAPQIIQGTPNWLANTEALWQTAAADHVAQGRVVLVFAQALKNPSKTTYIEGQLLGTFPFQVNKKGALILWINVDPLMANDAPWFSTETLIHELGHRFGLFHTFENRFNCMVNDAVTDTPLSNSRTGFCDEGGVDTCGQMQTRLDYTNLMSYGNCRVGTQLTRGQFKRMRCVVENHMNDLIALADSVIAKPPTNIPTIDPNMMNPTNTQPSPPQQRTTCNGIRGYCIDTDAVKCAGKPIAGRCAGKASIMCCPNPSAPAVTPLAGVGTACIAIDGVCMDIDVSNCATGFVGGKCVGPKQVKCCPRQSIDVAAMPATVQIDQTAQVQLRDTIAYPVGFTVHVGSQIWAPTTVPFSNTKTYLIPASNVHVPMSSELVNREIDAQFNPMFVGFFVTMLSLSNGQYIDRGDYLFIVTGTDNVGEQRTLVSTLITVDVGSCPLVSPEMFNVPYGLLRTSAACKDRNGIEAQSTIEMPDPNTVCCVQATQTSTFSKRATVDGAEVPSTLTVEWRGLTSFWGAPMTLTLKSLDTNSSSNTVSLRLFNVGEPTMELPAVIATFDAIDAQTTFTPNVANPGVYKFVDESGRYASASFSVVSLPCKLASSAAGYCRPRTNIGGTDSSLVCSDASAANNLSPCDRLSVGQVKFACCSGSPSALQKQASYLNSLEFLEPTDSNAISLLLSLYSLLFFVLATLL